MDVNCSLSFPPSAFDPDGFTGRYSCAVVEIGHAGPGVSEYDRGTFELRRID